VPVNSTHADYDAALPGWTRGRDLLAGEDAVKAAGEKYLPKLDAQTNKDSLAYQSRACFLDARCGAAGQGRNEAFELRARFRAATTMFWSRFEFVGPAVGAKAPFECRPGPSAQRRYNV
jgi:hypothetical protein